MARDEEGRMGMETSGRDLVFTRRVRRLDGVVASARDSKK